MRALTVLATGPQALVQDLGRPGNAHLGVPPSGALDAPALRLANRMTGNPEHAAGLELLLGGLRVRAEAPCTVAVGSHRPVHLRRGDLLEVGTPSTGMRCYLGVSGGIAARAELGSRSTDLLSGIGPAPLAARDSLPLGEPAGPPAGADEVPPFAAASELVVPLVLGPRADWFGPDAGPRLAGLSWVTSEESNRVGLRCTGPALRRAAEFDGAELSSEAVLTGAVQVPANGIPLIFLADHPTTGGYPVIGVVPERALPMLAQARPGTPLRLRPR
jgi:biotin-dependent carboxylase-like uncharacterized protein